jgi:hypothetical protein
MSPAGASAGATTTARRHGLALGRLERRVIHAELRARGGIVHIGNEGHLLAGAIEGEAAIRGRAGEQRGDRAGAEVAHECAVIGAVTRGDGVAKPLLVLVEGEIGDPFDARVGAGAEVTQHEGIAVLASRPRRLGGCRCGSLPGGTVGALRRPYRGGIFQQISEILPAIAREAEGADVRHAGHIAVGHVHDAQPIARLRRATPQTGALHVGARRVAGEHHEAGVRAELRRRGVELGGGIGRRLQLRSAGEPAGDVAVFGGAAGGAHHKRAFPHHRAHRVSHPLAVVRQRGAGNGAPFVVRVLGDRFLARRQRRRGPTRYRGKGIGGRRLGRQRGGQQGGRNGQAGRREGDAQGRVRDGTQGDRSHRYGCETGAWAGRRLPRAPTCTRVSCYAKTNGAATAV